MAPVAAVPGGPGAPAPGRSRHLAGAGLPRQLRKRTRPGAGRSRQRTRVGDHTTMSGQAIHGDTIGKQSGQVAWPVLSGLIPPLAESYTPRTESGLALAGSLEPGETAVLVTADDTARELGAVGGTGKTQLAAAIAHTLWDRRAVDLLVWVTVSGRDAVLAGYAQAMGDVGEPEPYRGPQAAASHFQSWLAETDRPWLAVLDDLTDPAVLDGLWPWGAGGRVVV